MNHYNYRTFCGILPSTGAERLSDTVKFQHRAIGIQEITPADRILKATKQLDGAIREMPKKALATGGLMWGQTGPTRAATETRAGSGGGKGYCQVVFCSLLYSFLLLVLLLFQLSTVQQQAKSGGTGRNRTDTGGNSNAGQDRGTGGQGEEVDGRAGCLRRRAGGGGEQGT